MFHCCLNISQVCKCNEIDNEVSSLNFVFGVCIRLEPTSCSSGECLGDILWTWWLARVSYPFSWPTYVMCWILSLSHWVNGSSAPSEFGGVQPHWWLAQLHSMKGRGLRCSENGCVAGAYIVNSTLIANVWAFTLCVLCTHVIVFGVGKLVLKQFRLSWVPWQLRSFLKGFHGNIP